MYALVSFLDVLRAAEIGDMIFSFIPSADVGSESTLFEAEGVESVRDGDRMGGSVANVLVGETSSALSVDVTASEIERKPVDFVEIPKTLVAFEV